jgi:hypothetical protein
MGARVDLQLRWTNPVCELADPLEPKLWHRAAEVTIRSRLSTRT